MKISPSLRSTVLAVASVAVFALGAPAAGQAIRDKPPLTIATYGGVYTKSQMKAYILPFRKASRRWVEVVEFSGGLGQIRQQVKTLNVKWDLVDIELARARRACEEGLLEPIDPAILKPAPDGTPAGQDFYPAALRRCGIGHVAFSIAVAYKPSAFDGGRPSSLADFFDVEKFPGKRGVRKAPSPNLEWALMAAGVAPDRVYDTLSTREGVDRAFKMLDRIKPHAVWGQRADLPIRLLMANKVVMTAISSGRAYYAIKRRGMDLGMIWDGQLVELKAWGILKGSTKVKEALAFISFATDARRLATTANELGLTPMRRSSTPFLDAKGAQFRPLPPREGVRFLRIRHEFWLRHGEALNLRFLRWLREKSYRYNFTPDDRN